MELTRIVVLVSLMLIVPATARASLWDWIQEMSGPGPFNGRGAVLATVCSEQFKLRSPDTLVANNRQIDKKSGIDPCWFFDLRQLAYNGTDGNFPAAVNLTAHDFGLTWQILPYRAVEVGFGVGITHFSGVNDVTANRFTITLPRVVVAPAALAAGLLRNPAAKRRWLRVVKYHVGYLWVLGALQAENFGVARGTGPGQSTFSSKGSAERLKSRGFFIDFGELLRQR